MRKYYYKNYNEVQNLIDNDDTIQYRVDLMKKYPGLYDSCYEKGWMKYLHFPKDSETIRWKDLNTVEEFQSFINNDPDIINKDTLRKKYPGIYTRARSRNILSFLIFKYNKEYINWGFINSLDMFIDFIDKNNILSRVELLTKFPGLYNKSIRFHWLKSVKFKKDRSTWENKSIEDIQELIDSDPRLINLESLKKYNYLGLLGYIKKNKLKIKFKSPKKSNWEIVLKNYLEENLNLVIEDNSKDSYSRFSKLDLYISKYNIAIEVQGPYHWCMNNKLSSNLKVRKSDIKKNRWCRDNGITLLYFTYSRDYEKYGYPYYIYTSEKELLNEIKNIIKNKGDGR